MLSAVSIARRSKSAAIATDAENRVLSCSRAALELLACQNQRALSGKNLFEALQARDPHGNTLGERPVSFVEMVARAEPIGSFEISLQKLTGQRFEVTASVTVVLGAEPEIVYFLVPRLRRRRADEAIDRLLSLKAVPNPKKAGRRGSPRDRGLTRRQLEVLGCLAEGRSHAEIAEELGVSVHTVRGHVREILRRLGVHGQVAAVALALREGLI